MRIVFFFIANTVFVSCFTQDPYKTKKCLSCNFYLVRHNDDHFSVIRKDPQTKKITPVVDSVEDLNWKNCHLFIKKKDTYTIIGYMNGSFDLKSFSSLDEMNNYGTKNGLIFISTVSSSRGVYELLFYDRVSCE